MNVLVEISFNMTCYFFVIVSSTAKAFKRAWGEQLLKIKFATAQQDRFKGFIKMCMGSNLAMRQES
jgi:hypothetical protein